MKILRFIILFLFTFQPFLLGQIHLQEGFEDGSKPDGWTEEAASGNEPWRYRNGGHSPNDNNWQVPAWQEDITRNPASAYAGTYNAIFFKQGDNNERTKLITPSMDLVGTATLELSFHLCQIPWTFEGATGWDVLRVYYKASATDPWILLHEYLDPIYDWEKQSLNLPNPSEDYYVAFEGQTRWGYGTCVDEILITETGTQELYVGDIGISQPFSNFTPSDVQDVPMMRMDFKIYGNTGSLALNQLEFTSLNSDDSDISPNGLKLYKTTTQTFNTNTPLGTLGGFSSGKANFNTLSLDLPSGVTYLWLTYDVEDGAGHENILDLMIDVNAIHVGASTFPSDQESPDGYRLVYETRYKVDFEGTHSWTMNGEFEVGSPNGMGGNPGNPNPSTAVSGNMALGTDLSGQGDNPYHYEPDLNETSAYTATSPNVEALFYKNLNLFFWRYLNIEVWDNASIEISKDDGTSWNRIWQNTSYLSDYNWSQFQISIPDEYSRSDQLKIRYTLGPTDGFNNYSGWNIDDIYLTGEFIHTDVGVSEWIAPLSGSGKGSEEEVRVRITNYGGAAITDAVPVAYSFDGGQNWTVDQMDTDIPVGGSVLFTFPTPADLSQPGNRSLVLAQTIMAGDQYTDNNYITTEVYVVPTYIPPYLESFEPSDGWWRSLGNGIWEHGEPGGATIDHAASGNKSWLTGASSTYGSLLTQPSQIIFEDDFETNKAWVYSHEFERAVPSNAFLPNFAYSGYYCIGTDLSGRGNNYYFYENGITEASPHTATSPVMDASSYSNIQVSFASWITIESGDSIRFEASADGGSNWETIWKNSQGEIIETDFDFRDLSLPASFNGSAALQFRFSLFHTSAGGEVAEGWNIDDFLVTGDLVNSEAANLSSPRFDLSGLTNPILSTKLWMDAESGKDGSNLEYSLDDGHTWHFLSSSSVYDSYWNWYNGHSVEALAADGWSGQSEGWITVKKLLPSALIAQDNVQFRYAFRADKVNNDYDGFGLDDIQILEAPSDIDMLGLLNPMDACELSSDQKLSLRLKNAGLSNLLSGDTLKLGFLVDHENLIQSAEEDIILTADWATGTSRDFITSTGFDFSMVGQYRVDAFVQSDDPHFYKAVSMDSISTYVLVQKPIADLGEDISTQVADTVVLRAYSGVGGQSYSWQDGSQDSIYHVSSEGKYYVDVSNNLCTASDTVEVMQLIVDVGVSTYLGPESSCELGSSLPLTVSISNTGTDTIEIGNTIPVGIKINSDSPIEESLLLSRRFFPGESLDFTFSGNFDFSAPGSYAMKLFTGMPADERTYNDTLEHLLEVYGYPDASLGPDQNIQAQSHLLSPAAGYVSYLWQDGSTEETFLVEEPGTGTYYVSISDMNACSSSDTVVISLNVPDIELLELLSPSTSCELSESITISARLKNVGNRTLNSGESIPVSYQINSGSVTTENMVLSQAFAPGGEIDFTFPNPETVETGQWYNFTVFVSYAEDVVLDNDTIHTSVGVFAPLNLDLGEDFQVILGLEHTLDAGPGYQTYLWQDGSTGQTYSITEPGIGTYRVTVSNANGCEATDEVEIMLSSPDIGVKDVSYPQTTCHLENNEQLVVAIQNFGNFDIEPGADITLAYSLNGGEEVREPLVLDALFENGTIIYHTFSKAEDFSLPGIYSIMVSTSYDIDQISSNDVKFVSINHKGIPVVDIGEGSDTLLLGEPIILTATPGYASYLWQDGSTENTYAISDPSAAWYKVIVAEENGCITQDSVFVVYDIPDLAMTALVSPVASCNQPVAVPITVEITNKGYYRLPVGELLAISYSVDGSASILEQITLEEELEPGATLVLQFAQSYLFGGPGTYYLQTGIFYEFDSDRSNNSLLTEIDIWDSPQLDIGNGADTIFEIPPVLLDGGSGFASYLWQDNSTGQTFTAETQGWFWLRVSNNLGCESTDSVFVKNPLAIPSNETFPGHIEIYPNPVRENLFINLSLEEAAELELLNITGQVVYHEEFLSGTNREFRLNVQQMTPGAYVLRIYGKQFVYYHTVIIQAP